VGGSVVATAPVASVVVEAIMPVAAAIVIDTVVAPVMANLMLALLMVRRVIAAVSRLCDSRHGDRSNRRHRDQGSGVAGMHLYRSS
jgi:hypothetical protein